MQSVDQMVSIESPFGTIDARVTGHALHMLWGADVGPQDADGLIEANRLMIEQVALLKYEAGELEEDGTVQVSHYDLEE